MFPSKGSNGKPRNNINSFVCQAALRDTCQEKTPTAWTKIKGNVLAHRKKIGPVETQ